MPRVMLTMTEEERQALVDLARAELRDPRAQGALLLRQALTHAGYLQQAAIQAGQPAQSPNTR